MAKARVPAVLPSAVRVQQAPPDAPHNEGCAPEPRLLALRVLPGLVLVLALVLALVLVLAWVLVSVRVLVLVRVPVL